MAFDPAKHHRRSIRLKEYDYSWSGWYYVTICAYDRACFFGKIVNDQVLLNQVGRIVEEEWLRTPSIRPGIELDEHVIMPNHLHGILIVGDLRRGVSRYAPTNGFRSPSQSLGAIIRGFKGAATKKVNILQNTVSIPLWQCNYYEHIHPMRSNES
jgi:REP element-mobilizing transposase RayT